MQSMQVCRHKSICIITTGARSKRWRTAYGADLPLKKRTTIKSITSENKSRTLSLELDLLMPRGHFLIELGTL